MRKMTVETLREAYGRTHVCSNGLDVDAIFRDGWASTGYWADRYSAAYYILDAMRGSHGFKVWCLDSDGGVRLFLVLFNLDGYDVIVSRERSHGPHSFQAMESLQDLADWLNGHAMKISSAACQPYEEVKDVPVSVPFIMAQAGEAPRVGDMVLYSKTNVVGRLRHAHPDSSHKYYLIENEGIPEEEGHALPESALADMSKLDV
jgi:hypothetical protein